MTANYGWSFKTLSLQSHIQNVIVPTNPSKLGNAVVFLGFSFVKAYLKYWVFHISNTYTNNKGFTK